MAEARSWSQNLSTLRQDFLASIVVFLVALPLCLGISIATGYPPAAGLISAVIGGIVVGYLSGCPLQVSGPAAGLITIVWEETQRHGIETVGLVILLAGMIQIAIGAMGLGLWFRAVSPAVIKGMLAGIGVLIFSSQFHVMVDDKPKSDGISNLLSIPDAIAKGLFPLDGSVHHIAATIGLTTIGVILLWNMLPARWKMVPAPLVAVVVATVMAAVLALPINYVEVPSDIMASLHLFRPEILGKLSEGGIIISAITIAFIASAETLLTATAIDQMTLSTRTNYNREIIAQGVGNGLAGLLGALPITGVIVRSSANVQAGAKSRMSTIFHGIWILLFVLLIPFVLELIPVASLAAVLVYTGYKLVNLNEVKKLSEFGKSEVLIYVATIVGIVATNLLEGVLIGLGLALAKQFYTHSHLTIQKSTFSEERQVHVCLSGSASFVTLPKLAAELESIAPGKYVFIHLEDLTSIDHACIELLKNWEKQYEQSGGTVNLEWDGVMNRYCSLNQPPQRQIEEPVEIVPTPAGRE